MRRQIFKLLCSVGIILASILSVMTIRELRAKYGGETLANILTETCFTKTVRGAQQSQKILPKERFDALAQPVEYFDPVVLSDERPNAPNVPEDRFDTSEGQDNSFDSTYRLEERFVSPEGPDGHVSAKDDAADINNMICNRFKTRSNVLNTACSASKDRQVYSYCEENDVKQNLKYSKKSNIMYCTIEKTGSTFWKRILYIIGGESNISNPTHIKTVAAEYSEERFCDMSDKNWEEIEEIFTRSTSIMFVRDPYERLFSAWLDKFYSPNTIYWNSTAKTIAKSQRKDTSERCKSDITFTEFVNHTVDDILSEKSCIDRHFSPNYKHCNPCKLNYEYIGKYETMKEDTIYILDVLNLTGTVSFSNFDEDAASDAIKDAADWVFFQRDRISKCGFSFTCALFRVWQRLQSRGVISNLIPFPFLSPGVKVTRDDFETALRTAHNESDRSELKHNRKEAMKQAVTSLPEHVREKIIKAFSRDFDMFGYDRDPEIDDFVKNRYFLDCPPDM